MKYRWRTIDSTKGNRLYACAPTSSERPERGTSSGGSGCVAMMSGRSGLCSRKLRIGGAEGTQDIGATQTMGIIKWSRLDGTMLRTGGNGMGT